MAMTQEEKIEIADMVRSRDRFGPVSEEELAALPGKETELLDPHKKTEKRCMFLKNVQKIYQNRLHCC